MAKIVDAGQFDEFLMKGMLGSKDGTTAQVPYNILTAVDRLNKEFDGIRGMYDRLCEFTHPNWSGVMGSYSVIEEEKFLLHLGKHHRTPPIVFGLGPFIACLAIFTDYYNSTAGLLKEINESYEQKAVQQLLRHGRTSASVRMRARASCAPVIFTFCAQ